MQWLKKWQGITESVLDVNKFLGIQPGKENWHNNLKIMIETKIKSFMFVSP